MIEGLKSIEELKAEFEALENEENEIDALLQAGLRNLCSNLSQFTRKALIESCVAAIF